MKEAHYDQFIGHYPALVPPDICMKTIQYFEEAHKINATYTRQVTEKIPAHVKADTAMNCNQPHAFGEMDPTLLLANNDISSQAVKDSLQHAVNDYLEVYSSLTVIPMIGLYHKIQKTRVGEGYHVWHFETSHIDMMNRVLTYTIYLNDVDEGGETEFLYQHKRYPARRGDVLIFPAHFTHTHRGNPPLSNDKYIITGWLNSKI